MKRYEPRRDKDDTGTYPSGLFKVEMMSVDENIFFGEHVCIDEDVLKFVREDEAKSRDVGGAGAGGAGSAGSTGGVGGAGGAGGAKDGEDTEGVEGGTSTYLCVCVCVYVCIMCMYMCLRI
jgi:hypothetical protein